MAQVRWPLPEVRGKMRRRPFLFLVRYAVRHTAASKRVSNDWLWIFGLDLCG
jgi:hypothetical protein